MDDSTYANAAHAQVAIAALIAALSNAGDAGDTPALSKLFAENGTYTLQDGSASTGPAAIEQMLSEFSKNMAKAGDAAPEYMRHHVTTSHVKVLADDAASGDTYFLNVNENGLDHWGRWRDRFTRDGDGRWLFLSREVVVEGMAATSWLKSQD